MQTTVSVAEGNLLSYDRQTLFSLGLQSLDVGMFRAGGHLFLFVGENAFFLSFDFSFELYPRYETVSQFLSFR